jgi:hypothetical protein
MSGVNDPRGSGRLPTPPKADLEDHDGVSDVARDYDVAPDVAARWLREHDLYEPERNRAGACSPLGKKLIDADPDDVTGGGE